MGRERGATRSVLLLGNYRPTLTVARTLAAEGFHVVLGLDHDPERCAHRSGSIHEVWDHPPLAANNGRDFRNALGALLARRSDIEIVYPVAEAFVRWCAEHHGLLDGRSLVALPAPATVLQCLDKLSMAELAEKTGVPCRPFLAAESLGDLHAAAESIGYPVVVRPLSHLLRLGGKKAVIARDRQELAAEIPAWPAGQAGVLLQQYATGARHDVYFAADAGDVFRILEVRIVRTDSLDGTGLSVEGETVAASPDLAEYTRRLVARLGYTGIGCAQFLVDRADGSVSFLELNPRIAGSHRCTEVAGMQLTRLAITLAEGGVSDADRRFFYTPGQIYAWTFGDLSGLVSAIANREVAAGQALRWLGRATATFLRADYHLTFDRRDPVPTLHLFMAKLARLRGPAGRFARAEIAGLRELGDAAHEDIGAHAFLPPKQV